MRILGSANCTHCVLDVTPRLESCSLKFNNFSRPERSLFEINVFQVPDVFIQGLVCCSRSTIIHE